MIHDTCFYLLAWLWKINDTVTYFNWYKRRRVSWQGSDPPHNEGVDCCVEGPWGKWRKMTWMHSNTRHIGVMVSFESGAASTMQRYWILTWKDKTSHTEFATDGPESLFDSDFKHLLNVIKQLGPLKHSTEMSANFDLQFSLLYGSDPSNVSLARILLVMASMTPDKISRQLLQ